MGSKRIYILGLDGVPFSLLNKLIANDVMPNFKNLAFNCRQDIIFSRKIHAMIVWLVDRGGKNRKFKFIARIPRWHVF